MYCAIFNGNANPFYFSIILYCIFITKQYYSTRIRYGCIQ